MYLARVRIHNQTHYFIRHSYRAGEYLKSRDLFDLGTDPTRFIIYPGGNSYYYDVDIIDALADQGVEVDQTSLDAIFFDFLNPEIQRVIIGFDRSYQGNTRKPTGQHPSSAIPPHLFDKRRFHFLRFGAKLRQQILRQPEKIFRPLLNKSRDELEQYFLKEEQVLKPHEIPVYVTTIFDLKQFRPDPKTELSPLAQLDRHFLSNLCNLNRDIPFWSGTANGQKLHNYLIKYAIMYFDFGRSRSTGWQGYIHDFINRHRAYHPPPSVQVKIDEAEKLFGLSWKELRQLDKTTLSRRYRHLALKHHPDQGGDSELFSRLTQYYQALLDKKA